MRPETHRLESITMTIIFWCLSCAHNFQNTVSKYNNTLQNNVTVNWPKRKRKSAQLLPLFARSVPPCYVLSLSLSHFIFGISLSLSFSPLSLNQWGIDCRPPERGMTCLRLSGRYRIPYRNQTQTNEPFKCLLLCSPPPLYVSACHLPRYRRGKNMLSFQLSRKFKENGLTIGQG